MWPVGTVTDISSSQKVEVNGIPRHVADVRVVPRENDTSTENQVDDETTAEDNQSGRPVRTRRRPDYYGNNIHDT